MNRLHDQLTTDSEQPAAALQPLKVLVVDDSATVRQVLTVVLPEKRGFRVTVAADPLIAIQKMKKSQPDVILLDLEMPHMDGLTFLRKLMAENPIPVIICSALTGPTTDAAIRALECGAVDIITKPAVGVRGFLEESSMLLEDTIRAAASARLRKSSRRVASPSVTSDVKTSVPSAATTKQSEKIIAIGASTGGTEALLHLFEQMPPDCPGIVAVQHMPEGFTAAFARRLNASCEIEVREAADGDLVVPGRAYIAPGNHHLLVHWTGSTYYLEVRGGALVSRHRPSVDVLFRSVAQAAGSKAIGILMTGMGEDGAEGLLEMKRAKALTIAQDEPTCVVFGMPRAAILRGAVDEIQPLQRIASTVFRHVGSSRQI
ncbi:MAG TPA: chemotaxis response regulator protein-glutamate methylesterase [Candidatus Eremiobacteraceae bacterium]|nr:chemotaxis response regulator protein-glutamate methylesterase [Candidatus Eremiobacteraceae bacterium]